MFASTLFLSDDVIRDDNEMVISRDDEMVG